MEVDAVDVMVMVMSELKVRAARLVICLRVWCLKKGGSVWTGRLSNKAGRVRLKSHIA